MTDPEEREIYPAPDAPLDVARKLYRAFRDASGLRTLVSWRSTWMIWTGQHWAELDTAHLRSTVYEKLGAVDYQRPIRDKGITVDYERTPWNPTKIKVANVLEAMAAVGHLSAAVDAPSWIAPRADDVPAAQMISCTNGLLSLATRELTEHTPALFNTVSVPFDYHADAPQPDAWLAFLTSVWPDDEPSIALLQEYVGYVLSGRTDMQKMLLLIGPTRSGKGTVARGVTNLVGRGHVTGPTLASLGTNFGLAPLLGKPLGIIADARLGSTPAHTIVERLLSITGEDMLTVDRKFRDPWSGKLPTRLIVLSNELPRFNDASGAIANRMLILQMTNSFLGREDRTLDRRLARELPGILNWALQGLDRLSANGRFTVPTSSTEATSLLMDLASPVSAFVRDCCERGPGKNVEHDRLYEAWKTWASDSGHESGAKATFGRNLRAVVPNLGTSQPRINGKQIRYYTHIGLVGVSPVSVAETADQRPSSDTNPTQDTLLHLGTAEQRPSTDTPIPVSIDAPKPQVTGTDTGDTGQTPFKGQQEKELCPDCQRAPARPDTGWCDFCTAKRRRQQSGKLSCQDWFDMHIADLRRSGKDTAESVAVFNAGIEAGYLRANLNKAVKAAGLTVIARTSTSVTWSLTGDTNAAFQTAGDWLSSYLDTLDADTVDPDVVKAAGAAAGYEWENVRRAAGRSPRIKSQPAQGNSKNERIWQIKSEEEAS